MILGVYTGVPLFWATNTSTPLDTHLFLCKLFLAKSGEWIYKKLPFFFSMLASARFASWRTGCF